MNRLCHLLYISLIGHKGKQAWTQFLVKLLLIGWRPNDPRQQSILINMITVITAPRKKWTFKDVPKASAGSFKVAVGPLRILRKEKKKEDLQNDVEEYSKIARGSLQFYRHFKKHCNKQWCKIVELESSRSSPERDQKFQKFRTSSICYWVLPIKCPSSFFTVDTVLSQVRHITFVGSRMISTVLSTTEMEVATYTSWMKLLFPRILIIPSHTLCTIWSLLVKFLAGIIHGFMDNAGTTNKNQYYDSCCTWNCSTMNYGLSSFFIYDSRAHKVCPRPIVF